MSSNPTGNNPIRLNANNAYKKKLGVNPKLANLQARLQGAQIQTGTVTNFANPAAAQFVTGAPAQVKQAINPVTAVNLSTGFTQSLPQPKKLKPSGQIRTGNPYQAPSNSGSSNINPAPNLRKKP